MKVHIGDRVRVIKEYGSASVGDEGIIRGLPGENGSILYQSCYAVEFPNWSHGHTCGGKVPSKNGQWLSPECLERIQSPAEKIVITHDGKTTTAKLYEGKEVTKTAEAKCSPDDKFDFAAGAKLAFERLMGEEKKEPPKFDKSMLTNGRFGYMEIYGWFVVVGDSIVYEKGGYDLLERMNSSGRYGDHEVKYIVDACSFQDAKATHHKAIWCAPDFSIL